MKPIARNSIESISDIERGFSNLIFRLIFRRSAGAWSLPAATAFLFFLRMPAVCSDKSELSFGDSGYAFSVSVATGMSPAAASTLIYSKEAVRYFSDFADSIRFISVDSTAHIAEMRISTFYYKAYSRYKRVLFAPDSILITLEKFHHNRTFLPRLKRITTRYYFTGADSGCVVHYHQNVVVDRKIKSGYRKIVRWQLDYFSRKLSEYLRENE